MKIDRREFLRKAGFGSIALASLPTLVNALATPGWAQGQTFNANGLRATLGEQITILGNGALGLRYFPDEGVSSIGDRSRVRLLIAATHDSYLVEGPDLLHLESARKVLSPGPRGSFDNGYTGISAVYAHRNGKLYAFYHAEDHEGMPSLGEDMPSGYYASVGVAESSDGGVRWTKLGQVVTSGKPKDFKAFPNHNARGAGLPGVVADTGGRYLYLYYTDQSFASRGAQICMARADLSAGIPGPGQWYKYDGSSFAEPGIGGRDVPILSVFHLNRAHALFPHVTYSAFLDRYLMIFNVNQWQESRGNLPAVSSGIYITHSRDGIAWNTPTQLVADYSVPVPGKSISWEATLLLNEESQGREGWLVYGFSPKWGSAFFGRTPHYMVGRKIVLEKSE